MSCDVLFQEMKQQPLKGDDLNGPGVEVVTSVVTLPDNGTIQAMAQSAQTQANVGGVVLQNGLTTNQVRDLPQWHNYESDLLLLHLSELLPVHIRAKYEYSKNCKACLVFTKVALITHCDEVCFIQA